MGSSSTPSTTTQRTEPPDFIKPYLQRGAQESLNAFERGGPNYYPGNTVVPFAPQTEQALARTEQRATQGSPVVRSAQDYAAKTLNGGFFGQNNAYLDQSFNRQADQIQNRLNTGFAGAGRNIEAARPQAAQELADLGTQVYGGAYESERNRQQGVLPYAPSLAAQDYLDINALGGVGQQVEDLSGRMMEDQMNRYNFEQQRPYANLDAYLGRVTGAYPGANTSQTTPLYRNRGAGALGGALSGATLGSAFGPLGTALGGIGGGILGFL